MCIRDRDIAAITAEFAKMPALYIADGHHRSAAAALVGAEKAKQNPNHRGDEEYNYFMAVCFPANQLTIIDYNRVVKDLNGLTPEQFLAALDKNFIVEEKGVDIYKPSGLHNFSLYLGGKWYSLTAKIGTYNDNDPIGAVSYTHLDVYKRQKFDCIFISVLFPFCIFAPMLEKNEIIQSALRNLKIEELNPMQEASLEQATGRKDVILLSPTGSDVYKRQRQGYPQRHRQQRHP